MKVLVVGAGATGAPCTWRRAGGARWRGGEVTLVARGPHGAALRAHGVHVTEPAGTWHAAPRVIGALDELAPAERFDVVLVTVKMGALPALLPAAAACVAPGGVLITGQNGVEAEELAAPHVPAAQLAGAIMIIGAAVPTPGHIEVNGMAALILGAHDPAAGAAATQRAADALAACGVNARATADLRVARWTKLVWNNAMNAVTALTGLPCRQAIRDPGLRVLVEAAMREVEAVARAQGIALAPDVVTMCLYQAEAVGDTHTSMLQDVRAGRPLEHDALVGVIVRRGAAHGVPTPVNAVLHPLLAAISARAARPTT